MSIASLAPPSLQRPYGLARDGALPWPWIALPALALAIAWQSWIGLWSDVSWLITADEKWFSGQTPYVDFLEMNPPGALLLYAPAVALAHALGLRPEFAVSVFGFAASAASLGLSAAILRRADLARQIGPAGLAFACLALLVLPGDAFMERDTMAGVFGLPFLAAMAARAARAPVDVLPAILAGAGAAAMAILKPPFVLVALMPAIYVSVKAGPRVWLRAPEVPAAIGAGAAGMAAIAFFFPAYARNILPVAVDVYLAIRESPVELVLAPGVACLAAMLILGVYIGEAAVGEPLLAVAGLGAIGAFLGYLAQGKGWLYQAYPALAYATIFAGLALDRRRADRTDLALGAATFAAGLAGEALVQRFGIPAGMAALAAALASRTLAAEPAPFLSTFARMGVPAAVAAACALFVPGVQPYTPLARELTRLGPHPTVMAISEQFSLSHPMVRRAGAIWVQSVPSLLITSGVRWLEDTHPGDGALKARLQPYADAELARLVSDIETRRPDAILVGPLNTRLHAAVWSAPEVTAAMADYRLFAENPTPGAPGEIWVRKDLVGLRPSIPPETPSGASRS